MSTVAVPKKKPGFFSPQNRYLAPLFISCLLLVVSFVCILESYDNVLPIVRHAAELIWGNVQGNGCTLPRLYLRNQRGILVRSPAYWP